MPSVSALARDFIDLTEDAAIGFGLPAFKLVSQRSIINLKVGPAHGSKEHFEVQLFRGTKGGLAVEIGFHAEHPKAPANQEVLDRLLAKEKSWRKAIGKDAFAGPFGKGPQAWRRISEVWDGVTFDGYVAVEAAERLVTYVGALVPALRGGPGW